MVGKVKNVVKGTETKVDKYYRNSNDNAELAKELKKCNPKGPLCVNITKLFTNEHDGSFYSFGRIMSGTLHVNEQVRVLGEGFTLEEEED